MTNLLTSFDSDKTDLGNRISAAPSIEEVVKLTDGYLSRLHRDMADGISLQKSRYAGYLLEILRYAIRTLNAVDKEVQTNAPRLYETRTTPAPKRFLLFGKTVQFALILALVVTLVSMNPAPWVPIFLVIFLLGTELYLHVFEWRASVRSRGTSDSRMPDEMPKIEVRLKISQIHAFLDCIADALSYADKALDEKEKASEKESGFLEKETQILRLFQDLLEAKAFDDGEWALKKIPRIQSILWEHGIAIKEFDPKNAEDILLFDMEPGADPSVNSHITIRPALIKGKRVLLRGRVAEPFSSAPDHSAGM